jgi:hypothetical protein
MATADIIGTDFLGSVSLRSSGKWSTTTTLQPRNLLFVTGFVRIGPNRPLTTESTWLII